MVHTYLWPLTHGFKDGDSMLIKGSLPSTGVRFDIDFHTDINRDDGDVLFHMSNRYGRAYDQIVLNSRKAKVGWLAEEIYNKASVLQPGTYFAITVVLSGGQFSVAVNGHHFANFNVRDSTRFIKYFSVTGEAEISSITFADISCK
ncbi:putative galectin [Trypoxylus dichotomus]